MNPSRSHIIWVPHSASGKIRKIFISAFLTRVLAAVILASLSLLPLLEVKLLRSGDRIDELEKKKSVLQSEISELKYVRQALTRIEEKEKRLRHYFGLDGYLALDKVMGGGEADLEDSMTGSEPDDDMLISPANSGIDLPRKLGLLKSNYEVLNRLADKKAEILESTPSIIPVKDRKSKISSEFGWRSNPFTQKREFHAGIDITGTKDTKIIAPAFGVVLTTGRDSQLGTYLVLQHLEGIKSIFGHLSKITTKEGSKVRREEVIAIMGNTGLSTSTHLHYAVLVNQKPVDPRQYILDWR